MEKIVDYMVAVGGSPDEITYSVRFLLNEGWQPSGNLFRSGTFYVQNMVKFELPPNV